MNRKPHSDKWWDDPVDERANHKSRTYGVIPKIARPLPDDKESKFWVNDWLDDILPYGDDNEPGGSVLLKKFIDNGPNAPIINFDVTNDYFSDLSSECLKYHMYTYDLGYLTTFVNQIPEDTDIFTLLKDIEGWSVEFAYETDKSLMAFVKIDEAIEADGTLRDVTYAEVVKAKGKISFNVAARQYGKLAKVREIADKLFPVPTITQAADTVPVNFWSLGPSGPSARQKKINPLHWDEIGPNYTERTRGSIEDLIAVRPPILGGKLILWYGEPGTGKSSAIRSLIHNWLPWCSTSYVVDPEQFFGSANYMLSVLLDKSNNDDFDFDPGDTADGELVLHRNKRWNLLIVEDADEFLQADAKQRTGQALSRLLNLSDGLIGQGLNFLVLITTNALLGEIHSAVQREGRCMSVNEFHRFNRDEAKLWLGEHADLLNSQKATNILKKEHTLSLAQLYDLQRDRQQIKDIKEELRTGVYI